MELWHLHNRFLCRRESWGYLLQDTLHDRLWAADATTYARIKAGDSTLPLFGPNPYRHKGSFILGNNLSPHTLQAPLSVSWSITARCNSHCCFCCTDSINSGKNLRDASLDDIEAILQVLRQWGVLRIIIGGGEPLTRPDISEVFALFRQYNIQPALATNGIALVPKILEDAASTCMNIQISLDTLKSERYYALRGVDALPLVLRHIQQASQTGVLVRVVTVLTTDNICELEAIGSFLGEIGIRQWLIFEMLPAGRGAACYTELHVSNDEQVRTVIAHVQRSYPNLSAWYWGNRPADGCSVYVIPDGSLALTDYHTNTTHLLSQKQLSLSLSEMRQLWKQVEDTDKEKMLQNFLAPNRLGRMANV